MLCKVEHSKVLLWKENQELQSLVGLCLVTFISFHGGSKSRVIAYGISVNLEVAYVTLVFKTRAPAVNRTLLDCKGT